MHENSCRYELYKFPKGYQHMLSKKWKIHCHLQSQCKANT